MQKVDVRENPAKRENRIKQQWDEQNVFQQSITNRNNSPSFVFYDGPPTANGMPHAGHVLGRVIKDFVARYKTMRGYQVRRKAGWDTHGLPVELGVEKQLGISGKQQIEDYGVEKFIKKCKESVFTYEREWKKFTEAIGYWVDMEDPYVTLNNTYIESEWHILSTLHKKGLLYKGYRVTPYCPSCQTSLSSHELAQGYKDVKDLTVTAKFKIKDSENEYFLGWTTTPWTLPANVGLAVNPETTYVKVGQNGEIYVVAKNRLSHVMSGDYSLISEHQGEEFVGLSYTPPFSFVQVKNGYKVIAGDFVTEDSGTGIVHIAPAYGEDDFRVAKANHLDLVNVVDRAGRYTEQVKPLAGKFVKDCDVEIIKMLANDGLLFDKKKVEHSYPHCWRCDSPLLYYAMEGWFIKTTAIKDVLLKNNESVEWHPDHIKHGRFGKFLENVVDWNLGRNRYWGTPLNIWVCEQCGHEYAPDSIKDLREKAIETVHEDIELHKPYVDGITLRCPDCGHEMKRTTEVIDVWFDSGSMPFAQYHYPFENKELFESQFPADFIAEGIDQTRGWFYSLLAVSSLYKGKAPYKRVLSLGHILDEDGRKMSKSKGNVIDPMELVSEFGADALRWALLSDSAPWNSKRFSKQVVNQAKSKLVDTLVNVHSFYTLYASIDQFDPKTDPQGKQTTLDQWILSRLNTVIGLVKDNLDRYEFTGAARELSNFVNELSNWYIRRSRARFWSEGLNEDKLAAYHTLNQVLVKLSQLLAPFTPFIADDIYSNLTGKSVHLSDFPESDLSRINRSLEEEMGEVLAVIETARSLRNTEGIKTKQPLSELFVIPNQNVAVDYLLSYSDIVKEEINVKTFDVLQDDYRFVNYQLKLNFATAGRKYGKNSPLLQKYLQGLSNQEARKVVAQGFAETKLPSDKDVRVTLEDVVVEKKTTEHMALASDQKQTIILNTEINNELRNEGFARELIRSVQEYRKELNLPIEKRADVAFESSAYVQEIIRDFDQLLRDNLLVNTITFSKGENATKYITVNGERIGLTVH
ncbi:isoleucine--tRNA ligase [Sporolactobacillus laevolacticus]|uniref:Isoleucine--tRNA ligase n=1 Tax=Sporolactobacillus laevolacticus DSM 442 TaxID=1395513 RepID=V6J6U6_9BACL|nr:isoleucine--tRNA ligase [Sporolactobacillus laevolacticus]EST12499.1 isoleucyl-tRNA synthase [Sporolactobacillus laevolacticus DSM 442]